MSSVPTLEKLVWTDADFDLMGWHDCWIHAYAALPDTSELVFDIDYILKWEEPAPPDPNFTFWIAPATLVFADAWLERFELEGGEGLLELSDLRREPVQHGTQRLTPAWRWTLDGHNGAVTLLASGFQQFMRRSPTHSKAQVLQAVERGGCSFERTFQTP